jgi:hypothetical protein
VFNKLSYLSRTVADEQEPGPNLPLTSVDYESSWGLEIETRKAARSIPGGSMRRAVARIRV